MLPRDPERPETAKAEKGGKWAFFGCCHAHKNWRRERIFLKLGKNEATMGAYLWAKNQEIPFTRLNWSQKSPLSSE